MINYQSGNVLFIILIAVALLAGLSYAVTQSSRGGGSGFSTQKADLYASEIIDYGNVVSQAVSQVRLRGYSDTQISLENDFVSGYANPNCTTDECKIFALNGGGISYQAPKSDWLDSNYSSQLQYGTPYFIDIFVLDVGEFKAELIMFIPYIKKEVCMAINSKLGIKPINADVPSETQGPFWVNAKFDGSYYDTLLGFDKKVSGDGTAGETTILHGKMAGCTEGSGTVFAPPLGSYHYFQVLIAR